MADMCGFFFVNVIHIGIHLYICLSLVYLFPGFSEMLQANKCKQKQSTDTSFSAGVQKKREMVTRPKHPSLS